MKTQDLTNKFALVTFTKTVLENCNPEIVEQSDNVEELEEYHENGCSDSGSVGHTIIEKKEDSLVDYYTGEEFKMNSYS